MSRRVQVLRLSDVSPLHLTTILNTANRCQSHIHFEECGTLKFDKDVHRLGRRGYDLDVLQQSTFTTIEGQTVRASWQEPVLILTHLAYAEREPAPGEQLAALGMSDDDVGTSVLSTGLWRRVSGARRLAQIEPYVLSMLALFVLTWWPDLDHHTQTRRCLLDYCDDNWDILGFFEDRDAFLCDRCFIDLERAYAIGRASLGDMVAARRLVSASRDQRVAFVAMPFDKRRKVDRVFTIAKEEYAAAGWRVVRSDELRRPRNIVLRIVVELLGSDRVIAEVTHPNPNVFYEVGYADAAERDLLLVAKTGTDLPFDLSHRHCEFWTATPTGLQSLRAAFRRDAQAT